MKTLLLAPAVALASLLALPQDSPAREQPNIVFFLVDDLGWGGMGEYGSELHETPHFDRLCRSGIRFNHAYAACTVCSPSRAAIFTGQHPARLRLTDWIPGHNDPDAALQIPEWKKQIDHELVTLPETLREQGYSTWFLGKWHLHPLDGWRDRLHPTEMAEHSPQAHGFDVNIGGREWGQPRGRGKYFFPFDMPQLEQGKAGEYLTDRLTDEALRLIDTAGEGPFFLYLSYYNVHTPLQAKPEDISHFETRLAKLGKKPDRRVATYAAMHKSVDDSVGRVMEKLASLGKAGNTLVIFTGDNGGDLHEACGGLRGRKALAFEGGVRVPTCVAWPGRVTPASSCDTPIIGMDYYPTIVDAVGASMPAGQACDGRSLLPLLDGTGQIDRQSLYWHYPHYHRTKPYSAVRRGDWKLIEYHEGGRRMLFNLATDPQERHDLSTTSHDKTESLHAELREWREDIDAQMPTPRPGA